jgi:hypothetical protein
VRFIIGRIWIAGVFTDFFPILICRFFRTLPQPSHGVPLSHFSALTLARFKVPAMLVVPTVMDVAIRNIARTVRIFKLPCDTCTRIYELLIT